MRGALLFIVLVGCHHAGGGGSDGSVGLPGGGDGGDSGGGDLGDGVDMGPSCTTAITYGDKWVHPPGHPSQSDRADGAVTWDGTCIDNGNSSYAILSNGWMPFFSGTGACVIALDQAAACAPSPATCATRISYGAAWIAPAGHPAQYDDVGERVTWDRGCAADGANSYATLSNGWLPHFTGASACELSLRYSQCGGLYTNALLPDCADPGVVFDGTQYVAACTSGNAADAFPLRTSPDLVHWTLVGHIFPSASKQSWAASDFWAPEIHHVGARWIAYFTARGSDGKLAIGAATAPASTGPFTDLGAPLVHDANMGLIDATEFAGADGTPYLAWKEDGNAVGQPTPIHGQQLAADGTALVGTATTLITNDEAWEGAVTEAPWVYARGGSYYLFYSGNSYANASYAVGVARATAPLGPYTKLGAPILTTNASWIGPGHCSVVDGPGGDAYMVYHAWAPGHVNGPGDTRELLVDRVVWGGGGWPGVPDAPSATSMPMP